MCVCVCVYVCVCVCVCLSIYVCKWFIQTFITTKLFVQKNNYLKKTPNRTPPKLSYLFLLIGSSYVYIYFIRNFFSDYHAKCARGYQLITRLNWCTKDRVPKNLQKTSIVYQRIKSYLPIIHVTRVAGHNLTLYSCKILNIRKVKISLMEKTQKIPLQFWFA